MPTYSYQCKAGHVTERVFAMKYKPDQVPCDTCYRHAQPVILKAPAGIVRNPAVPRRRA